LMKAITRSERNFAHRLIEEFMLAANESVASYLENRRVPSLYRIHEKPDARRVLEFEQIAAGFGYSLGVGPIPIHRISYTDDRRPRRRDGRTDRGGQRRKEIDIPQDVHITLRMYQNLAKKIAGKPEERILSFLMLRSLKQARYSEENDGHFALAASAYTHFTSPIRRYPDLIVHRILKQVLQTAAANGENQFGDRGLRREEEFVAKSPSHRVAKSFLSSAPSASSAVKGPYEIEELHEIAAESSESERRADDAERELMEWKKAKFMADRVGEDFDGLIISVTKFGFFVELTDMFIEGLVPIASLTDDRYVYHDSAKQIVGQHSRKTYALGQKVRVLVDRIDAVQRKIQFAVMPEPTHVKGKRKRSRQGTSS